MGPRILLVDEDAAVRESMTFALEVEGFDVASFASAEAALATPSAKPIACAVIDYRLPDKDGLALIVSLRRRHRSLPVIVVTGQPSQRLKAQVAAMHALLVEKPLLCGAVVETIRAALFAKP